jgi:hypothetical protein
VFVRPASESGPQRIPVVKFGLLFRFASVEGVSFERRADHLAPRQFESPVRDLKFHTHQVATSERKNSPHIVSAIGS